MNFDEIYRISDGVRTREEDFGLLIVSKSTPALALNEDMKIVWDLIDGKTTCEKIISAVKAKYTESDVNSKVAEIFDTLIKIKLIQLVQKV